MESHPPLKARSPVRAAHTIPESHHHRWLLISLVAFFVGFAVGMLFSDSLESRVVTSGRTFEAVSRGRVEFPTDTGLVSVDDSISEVCCNCFSRIERGPYACVAADGLCGICEKRCKENCLA